MNTLRFRSAAWLLAAVTGLTAAGSGRAAGSFEKLESAWGPARCVKAGGTKLYACVHRRMQIYSLGEHKTPQVIFEGVSLDQAVEDIALANDTAFVAAGAAGLQVYDVAHPAQAQLLATLTGSDFSPASLATDGHILYAASSGRGIKVIDVSDRAHPLVIATYLEGSQRFKGLALQGTTLFANTGEFVAIDVSHPEVPVRVGSVLLPAPGQATAIDGKHAYIAAGEKGLRVVDIADPAALRLVGGSVRHKEEAFGVAVAAGYAYVADKTTRGNGGDLRNNPDAILRHGGLRVVDVRRPSRPVEVAYRPAHLSGVAARGSQAYTTVLDDGFASKLLVYDVTEPRAPKRTAVANVPVIRCWDKELLFAGDSLYGADRALNRLNLADPRHPHHEWGMTLPAYTGGFYDYDRRACRAMVMDGGFAYVDAGDAGLKVVDLTDPDHPKQLSRLLPAGVPVLAGSGLLFAMPNVGPAHVFDIADPHHPAYLGRLPAAYEGWQMRLRGRVMYMITKNDTIRVLDVTDPLAPVQLNSVPVGPNHPVALELQGDLLYLLTSGFNTKGLYLYSTANVPDLPLLSQTPVDVSASYMSACDQVAYFALPISPNGRVIALDVTDPVHPSDAGSYLAGRPVLSAACKPGGMVAAGLFEGVVVLQHHASQAAP